MIKTILSLLLILLLLQSFSACSLLLTDPLAYPEDQSVEIEEDMQVDMFPNTPILESLDIEVKQTFVDAAPTDAIIDQLDMMMDESDIN